MIVHVLRKPLTGTVAANALQHGCGALNIDGCRVSLSSDEDLDKLSARSGGVRGWASDGYVGGVVRDVPHPGCDCSKGRWPANLIHDGDANAVFPVLHGAGFARGPTQFDATKWNVVAYAFGGWCTSRIGDSGSTARFFQQVEIK